jgi:hypothetical protein
MVDFLVLNQREEKRRVGGQHCGILVVNVIKLINLPVNELKK